MKALAALLLGASLVMVLTVTPAFAQRDPFDPVIGSTTGSTNTDGSATGPGTAPNGDGTTGQADPTQTGADVMPNTGADPMPWLALAYALVAIGGALVVLGRLHGPLRAR
jgi:hypothetical protein